MQKLGGVAVFFSQGSGPHGRGNGSDNYSSSTPRTKGCGCATIKFSEI